MTDILKALELMNTKVLLLTAENESNINTSAQNIHKLAVKDSVTFSTYDILWADKVVVQEGALTKINEVLAG
jgi:large subunit ribosomal protein L4